MAHVTYGQDQRISDSLEIVYNIGDFSDAEELEILELLTENETDLNKQLDYSRELIIAGNKLDSSRVVYGGYLLKGNAHLGKGDYTDALDSYLEAANIAEKANLEGQKAQINIAIADTYSKLGNNSNAMLFYRKALNLYQESGYSIDLAVTHFNFGDNFFKNNELDSALYHLKKSEDVFIELGVLDYIPYIKGSEGLVLARKGESQLAESLINEAVIQLEDLGDFEAVCEYTTEMSKNYELNGDSEKALEFAEKSLTLASRHGLKKEIGDANLRLSQLYEFKGNIRDAFTYYKNHIVYRDSVLNIDKVQKLEAKQREFEVAKKQAEVDLLDEQKKNQIIINIAIGAVLVLIVFLAFSLFKRNKFMKRANEVIAFEKKRSEDLLTNILPEETAEELKNSGSVEAKRYESVSVLFTDFKGFTEYSEKLSPEDLVKSIDYYFSKFDEVMERHGIEKIKTVGDAYMCACGIPNPNPEHAIRITNAALEIVDIINQSKYIYQENLAKFDIRVGINTGPVVAGVVGTKKFAYDIWGDTVNVASRMESSGEIGRVNISESTYNILKENNLFTFEPRGEITAKGKGKIKMFFVNRKAFV